MSLLRSYIHLNTIHLFIGIIGANILIILLSKVILINEIVFFNTFSEQLSYDRSMELFETMQRFVWISYVITPLILIIKFTLVSMVLYSGVILLNIKGKVSFSAIFKVVVASEAVFVLSGISKFIWFWFFAGNYDLNDLNFFYPLSLINLFTLEEVNRFWILPLQSVNLFQVLYIFFLSWGFYEICDLKKADSDRVVLFSYIPAQILWLALIIFLSIDASL